MAEAIDMLAEIQNLAESLPSRVPSVLRVGPYVPELLRLGASGQRHESTEVGLPLGVTVIRDDSYAPGEWRLFDQWDEELHSGQIEALRDLGPGMTVHTEHLPPGVAAILIAPLESEEP